MLYNTPMPTAWVRSLRRLPWLEIATYAGAGVLAATGLLGLNTPAAQWQAAGLLAAFGLLLAASFRLPANSWGWHPYLAAQTGLVIGLVLLRPVFVSFSVLFILLGSQATRALPLRPAVVWLVLIVLGSGASFSVAYDEYRWAVILPTYAGYAVFGAFGYSLRQAEAERRRSQALLEELRATQRQLQELAVGEARNRLARDLHDSAKQQAFALSAQLDAVRSLLPRDPPAAAPHVEQAIQLADNLRQELAGLILQLRPTALGEAGLPAALRAYAAEWSQHSGIAAAVEVVHERPLPPDTQHALFRIAQEALANAARHSRARHVDVRLDCAPPLVRLTIADDGRGFDPHRVAAGVGTHSMRERAAELPQGALRLESRPGGGTRLDVTCAA